MKKKSELTLRVKNLIKSEVKRFATIIDKYYPNGKDKREIVKKFGEIAELIEKGIG